MRESLDELDGVFTYICVTKDALGVAKDEMAAKPLVLYEADDLVALASEEIAIRAIIDHEIDTYDPYEGRCWYGSGTGERRDQLRRARARRAAGAEVPRVSEIDGETAVFDAHDLTTRQINLELRWLALRAGRDGRHRPEPGREALARRRHPDALPDHASRAASATSAAA